MNILIGDVHGCLEELQALWQKLPIAEAEKIIFLGDLVDKGPDSTGVLDFVLAQQLEHSVVLLQGNHEQKALRRLKQGLSVQFLPSQERLMLLENALPFFPFAQGLAVHAGIFPAFWQHYPQLPDLKYQSEWSRKLWDRVQRFTICRYVNPDGNIVSLGCETEVDRFWAEVYSGQAGTIFFGHQPYLDGVHVFPHAYGLDTGCVFGGQMTAAVVANSGEISWIQEQARETYCEDWFENSIEE